MFRHLIVISITILFSMQAIACPQGNTEFNGECFEGSDPNDPTTKSNPFLRPVKVIQQDELADYQSAGKIALPYKQGFDAQGWLVNSCIVIAPRHAIVATGHIGQDLSQVVVDFKLNYQSQGNFKQTVRMSPIACGKGNVGDEMADEDFCLFKTDHALKDSVKPIKMGAIDYDGNSSITKTAVGFFPQASGQLDVLAKDDKALIVGGTDTFFDTRTAVISGAGIIDTDSKTGEKKLIGMQVGNFTAVNADRILKEVVSLKSKNPAVLKCN